MNIPERVKAEFKIKFGNPEDAEIAFKTIEVELKSAPSQRSSVSANIKNSILYLMIDAEDAHILRAAINSYLRWILLSHEVQKINK